MPATRAFPTLLFAAQMFPLSSFVDQEFSPYVLAQKIPTDPGTTCTDDSGWHCQMLNQRSTFPQSTNKHPPTCCKYFQNQQPDCHVRIQVRWKRLLESSHQDKSKIQMWRSGPASIRCNTALEWQHYQIAADKASNRPLLPSSHSVADAAQQRLP